MMFGRIIRTKIDLIIPDKTPIVINKPNVTRKLAVGDRVAVRDYLMKDKWKFGMVTRTLGQLHYEVKLDDGRLWKRHIEQMRKIGDNTSSREDVVFKPITLTPETPISNSPQPPKINIVPIPSQVSMPNNSSDNPATQSQAQCIQPTTCQPRSSPLTTPPIMEDSILEPPTNETLTDALHQTPGADPYRKSTRTRREPNRLRDYLPH